jgi:hypothetical protein
MRLRIAEFDLLYLALLTKEQVKPLSRWEKKFGPGEIKALKSLGLKTRSIERRLESGRRMEELVFSKSNDPIKAYREAFEGRRLDNSFDTALLEGKLFGYPECCVKSFATHGYLPNGLASGDQEILFYWACPDCRVTPGLVPRYRSVYEEAQRLQLECHAKKVKRKPVAELVACMGLASCLLLSGCGSKTTKSEPEADVHWIALEQDADQDYLRDEWEAHFLLNPSIKDTDRDGVPDGPQLAKSMWNTIKNSPDSIDWVEVKYRNMYGLYTCSKCGETVNMGYVKITNLQTNDSICVDILALHFMEHGSFAYEAKEGISGVVNPIELDSVLSK